MRRRAAAAAGGGGAAQGKSLRPSLNLLAAAMAGAVNQAITLPLENITTRMQTEPQHTHPPPVADTSTRLAMEAGGDGAGAEGRAPGAGLAQRGVPSSEESSGGVSGIAGGSGVDPGVANGSAIGWSTRADADIRGGGDGGGGGGGHGDANMWRNGDPAPPAEMLQGEGGDNSDGRESMLPPARQGRRRRLRPRQSVAAVTGELYREGGGLGRFWRGFAPSLILTCNPAINYTAFDVLKALWIRRRSAAAAAAAAAGSGLGSGATAASTAPPGSGRFLNPLEAFFVAAAAKSLATLITYPLIRAKVVLMTSSSSPSKSSSSPNDVDSCSLGRRGGDEVGGTPESSGDDGMRRGGSRSCGDTYDIACGAEVVRDRDGDPLLFDGEADTDAPPLKERGGPLETRRDGEDKRSNTRGMATVLVEIFRREGLGGLYAGCGAQVCYLRTFHVESGRVSVCVSLTYSGRVRSFQGLFCRLVLSSPVVRREAS